jgi:alpha-methylacyl-CoA racemase
LFADKDVCVTPVLSIEEVVRDPHWQATGAFVDYEHPQHGSSRQVRPIGPADARRGAAPDRGFEATRAALRSFGLTDQDISDLKASGTI